MSVADKLGTGSSFSHAPRGRSARGRAKAVTQGDVPAYELVRLHLDEVSPTPLNPRRNFGTDEDKTRFGEELRQAQLAACVAVSRNAYLALWPDHAERIGDVAHVLVNGERRYHSAVHVGLDALDFVVRDDLASSREEFINHLLQENLEREDFDVIERARGVEQLVTVCAEQSERGARSRAAERLRKDRSWVTNQLVLLDLPDEVQAMLSAGSMPERDGRFLARHAKENPELDAAGLLDYLKLAKAALARSKAEQSAQLQALRGGDEKDLLSTDNVPDDQDGGVSPKSVPPVREPASGDLLSADNNPGESSSSTLESSAGDSPAVAKQTAGLLSADNKAPQSSPAVSKPRTLPSPRGQKPPTIELRNPEQIAADVTRYLTLEQLAELAELLLHRVSAAE